MNQSITNKLIANIKKASLNTEEHNFINTNNVICIDSSNNRIGINTRQPQYSIEISGSSFNHGLKARYLIIDNSANINEIICNQIRIDNELSANKIDVNTLFFNEISGNFLNVSTISADTIKLITLEIPDISVNDLCVNSLDANSITCKTITADNQTFPSVDCSTLIVDQNADVNSLFFNEASGQKLFLENLDVSFLDVSNAIIKNTLDVGGYANFSEDIICSKSITSQNMECDTITISDSTKLKFGESGTISQLIASGVNDNFNNIGSRIKDTSIDLRSGNLLLPLIDNNNLGGISFNNENLEIRVGIGSGNNYVNFKSIQNKYIVLELSNNPVASNEIFTYEFNNYKKINLHIIEEQDDISYNIEDCKIQFDNKDESLEIHANITLQLENINPGDIEVKNYSFGIYNYINDNSFNELVSCKNTIMVVDTSFNYANSSLSFISPTPNTTIAFYIKQDNQEDLCLNNINVHKFNGIIKQR